LKVPKSSGTVHTTRKKELLGVISYMNIHSELCQAPAFGNGWLSAKTAPIKSILGLRLKKVASRITVTIAVDVLYSASEGCIGKK